MNRNTFLPFRNLGIGDVFLLTKPENIRTILGSCLTVTMWDKKMRAFAICHAVYAGMGEPGNTRYIDCSLDKMIKFMHRKDVTPKDTIVKFFGGMETGHQNSIMANKIVNSAKDFLHKNNYTIAVEETGGDLGRELYFTPITGDVFIRKVQTQEKGYNEKD